MCPNDLKRFTSEDCLQYLITKVQDEPHLLRFHLKENFIHEMDYFHKVLWRAVIDPKQWTRLSTIRPPLEEGAGIGTNKEIRIYENELWLDHSYILKAFITTEFGEFLDLSFELK